MRPLFRLLLVLRFLKAVQCRQCFLEVRLMPCRHCIEIHHVRANPPVATVDVNFCSGGNMTVVFACEPIHFKDDLFRATQLNHRFSVIALTVAACSFTSSPNVWTASAVALAVAACPFLITSPSELTASAVALAAAVFSSSN